MGSFRHPKVYDPDTVKSIRNSFHEIMGVLDEHYIRRIGDSEERLKATLIERLLTLASDGTPESQWKRKILSNLPLR
jgi:hypothetical protein